MEILENYYGRFEKESLELCENEVALRLKTARGYTNELVEKCKKMLFEKADCRYCARLIGVEKKENTLDFGLFSVESGILANLLIDCDKVLFMAITLGNGVDMLLRTLEVKSAAEYYITDALASALIETMADKAQEIIQAKDKFTTRFSPGFADFGIEKQTDVLDLLDARKLLGITLSKTNLMIPQKTITALMGKKS